MITAHILRDASEEILIINDGITAHHIHADPLGLSQIQEIIKSHLDSNRILMTGEYGVYYVCQNCGSVQLIGIKKGTRAFDIFSDLRNCTSCNCLSTFVRYGVSTK